MQKPRALVGGGGAVLGIDCFVISEESTLHSRNPSLSSESVVMG